MKVFHLIEKLRTLNPNLTVSFELADWVEVPDGAGECGEMMYRERRREKGLDATCKLRPDDVQPIADHLVISLRQIVRYELTDRLQLRAELHAANQHTTRDPEEVDLDAIFGPITTLIFPAPEAAGHLANHFAYPWGVDQRDLAQAQEEAAWLADWLSKMSDQSVKMGSILVLPGWFIDRRSKLSVTVLSGSEVAANIPKLNGTATTDSDVRRMAAMLEDRNRSVEY